MSDRLHRKPIERRIRASRFRGAFDLDDSNKFAAACVAAIENENNWQRALELLCDLCGAKAVMITLRENKTCQIVDDVALRERHHSPYVVGFKPEEVVYYIEHLREKDIWADFQVTYRPLLPTQMSTHVSSEEFGKTELGQWCGSQGINDTIVVQLVTMSGYWTALNIFFDSTEAGRTEKIFSVLNAHLDFLKNAWNAGRSIVRSRETGRALLNFLSDQGIAACKIDRSGRVLVENDQFETLRKSGVVKVTKPADRLSVSDLVDTTGLVDSVLGKLLQFATGEGETRYSVLSRPVFSDPYYEGLEDPEQFLIFEDIGRQSHSMQSRIKAQISALTRQEHRLFEAISNGLSVSEAGESIGIKRSRAFDVWRSVKEKLNIEAAHQLRIYKK